MSEDDARADALQVLHAHRRKPDRLTFDCALDAMLTYAEQVATRREEAMKERCAGVAHAAAACGCGRSDCQVDGLAFDIAAAIRALPVGEVTPSSEEEGA